MLKFKHEKLIRDAIYTTFHTICKKYHLIDIEDLTLDVHIIGQIMDRVSRDFDRIEHQHPHVKGPDCHKISGCITYWICKLSPIKNNNYGYSEYSKYINQIFALFTSTLIINLEKTSRTKSGVGTEQGYNNLLIGIPDIKRMTRDYMYTLKYCNINPDLLSIIYYFLDITACNKEIQALSDNFVNHNVTQVS